jgi:hypothetical protein
MFSGSFTLAKFVGGKCHRQRHETVLAVATLGDVTKNINNPISSVVPPKNNGDCRGCYFSKLCQCKHSFRGAAELGYFDASCDIFVSSTCKTNVVGLNK